MSQKMKRNQGFSWYRFIETSHASPGKIYGLIKTHKVGNPVRVITIVVQQQ